MPHEVPLQSLHVAMVREVVGRVGAARAPEGDNLLLAVLEAEHGVELVRRLGALAHRHLRELHQQPVSLGNWPVADAMYASRCELSLKMKFLSPMGMALRGVT